MFGSHKRILTIVLTVVSLLAMLAPAAMAAPEVLHGVDILTPNSTAPAKLDAWGGVDVTFNIKIVNTQVCNVEVKFYWVDQLGNAYQSGPERLYEYQTLHQGLNTVEATDKTADDGPDDSVAFDSLPDGWYDLKIVAQEDPKDPKCDWTKWSDTEPMALLVDRVAPKAELVKPGNEPDHEKHEYKGGTFVTGQDFLFVGTAWDRYGIAATWFELCPEGSWACHWTRHNRHEKPVDGEWIPIGNENAAGVAQDAIPTPGVPGQWQATWNSTRVPDGFYLVRFCAEDLAGNSNCYDERIFRLLAGRAMISTGPILGPMHTGSS